jgi:hypothetical protein
MPRSDAEDQDYSIHGGNETRIILARATEQSARLSALYLRDARLYYLPDEGARERLVDGELQSAFRCVVVFELTFELLDDRTAHRKQAAVFFERRNRDETMPPLYLNMGIP